jgi:hypothetical protein
MTSIRRLMVLVLAVSLLTAAAVLAGQRAPRAMADPDCLDAMTQVAAESNAEEVAQQYGFLVSQQDGAELLTFPEAESTYGEHITDVFGSGTSCTWVISYSGSMVDSATDSMRVLLDAVTGLALAVTGWNALTPTVTDEPIASPTSGPSPTRTSTLSPRPSPTP